VDPHRRLAHTTPRVLESAQSAPSTGKGLCTPTPVMTAPPWYPPESLLLQHCALLHAG